MADGHWRVLRSPSRRSRFVSKALIVNSYAALWTASWLRYPNSTVRVIAEHLMRLRLQPGSHSRPGRAKFSWAQFCVHAVLSRKYHPSLSYVILLTLTSGHRTRAGISHSVRADL